MAAAVRELASDDALWIACSAGARKKVEGIRTWQEHAARLAEVIRDVYVRSNEC
ncbi:MAG: hypothetical protein H0X64_10135 [Gemmatimonadaceae bacterium]|nr:hypothetical protein [Gemmatimonadaceae bacterium]